MPLYWGEQKPQIPPSCGNTLTVLLVWATSTPGPRNTLPVPQCSTVTWAVLLGFLQLQSNIYFLSLFFLSFLSAVVVAQLLYLFFFFSSSKQHTTHFHKRKYSKWSFKKKFITSVNQQIVFISNKATLSFFFPFI